METRELVGLDYLDAVTTLSQRVRAAHPTFGQFEAADFQWWWRTPRSTDVIPKRFWYDDSGQPVAAVITTEWKTSVAVDPIVLPDSSLAWRTEVLDQGLRDGEAHGLSPIDVVVENEDQPMIEHLAARGYTDREAEGVEAWIRADDCPAISPLARGYRLTRRAEDGDRPHHMIPRSSPDVEARLRQTSLYRPDMDLLIRDADDDVAAYGLFWYDPVTATGLVEPMRTEDAHQRLGLARHLLTAGLQRLIEVGAERVKICYIESNPASSHLYLDVGFVPVKWCSVLSRSTGDPT